MSWLADTAAHWMDPWTIGLVYSVGQVAIIAGVLLPHKDALRVTIALVLVAVASVFWHGAISLIVTFAWGLVTALAWSRLKGTLRVAMLLTFGVGLLAWWGMMMHPSMTSWGTYQVTRLAGTIVFCKATA